MPSRLCQAQNKPARPLNVGGLERSDKIRR